MNSTKQRALLSWRKSRFTTICFIFNCFFNNEAPVYHRKKLPLQNEFNETRCFIVLKEITVYNHLFYISIWKQ